LFDYSTSIKISWEWKNVGITSRVTFPFESKSYSVKTHSWGWTLITLDRSFTSTLMFSIRALLFGMFLDWEILPWCPLVTESLTFEGVFSVSSAILSCSKIAECCFSKLSCWMSNVEKLIKFSTDWWHSESEDEAQTTESTEDVSVVSPAKLIFSLFCLATDVDRADKRCSLSSLSLWRWWKTSDWILNKLNNILIY